LIERKNIAGTDIRRVQYNEKHADFEELYLAIKLGFMEQNVIKVSRKRYPGVSLVPTTTVESWQMLSI